jgi:hypothetical protein
LGRGRRTGAVRMGSGGGRGEAAREVKRRAATLDKPAAAGMPRRNGRARKAGGYGGAADARARARGRERGGRQVGPGGGEKKKGNSSTCKFKNMHFPGSKIHQIFTGAILNHQEHNAATRAQ